MDHPFLLWILGLLNSVLEVSSLSINPVNLARLDSSLVLPRGHHDRGYKLSCLYFPGVCEHTLLPLPCGMDVARIRQRLSRARHRPRTPPVLPKRLDEQ